MTTSTDSKLSFKKAAQKILSDSGEPLSAKEITAIALEKKLIRTEGKTPDATMAALIYTDIKGNKKTAFQKVGKGKFALKTQKASASSPLLLIEQQNELVKKRLKEQLHSMDPFQFEFFVADLLKKIGYENVEVTRRSGDKGIDITANLTVSGITNVKTVIQVKRYKEGNKLAGKHITQLRGPAEVDQRGLIITTSDFTKDAREEAKASNKMPVALVNGQRLMELLFKYEVGVKKEQLLIYSLDNDFFGDEPSDLEKIIEAEKNRSLWPLPGGAANYINTLNEFLEKIASGSYNRKQLIKWVIGHYDNVNSEQTASGYLYVPKNIGLTDIQNGVFQLTEVGKKYLSNRDPELLYEVITKNILAFDDIYQFLANAEEPQSEDQILDYLKENFDINWQSYAQVTFRISWLSAFGKVEKLAEGYDAVNEN